MSDVLDDVDGVGLPHWHGDLYVLLNGDVDLPDHLVGPVYWNVHLPDDFEWHVLDDLYRNRPLYLDVLRLVDGIGYMFHDVHVDRVGLWHGHAHLMAYGHGHGVWHGDLHVTCHLNWHSANNILDHRLQLVTSGGD